MMPFKSFLQDIRVNLVRQSISFGINPATLFQIYANEILGSYLGDLLQKGSPREAIELAKDATGYVMSLLGTRDVDGVKELIRPHWSIFVHHYEESQLRASLKELKDYWGLEAHDVGAFLGSMELQMEGKNQAAKARLRSKIVTCLEVFELTEKTVCYSKHILGVLQQSVGMLFYETVLWRQAELLPISYDRSYSQWRPNLQRELQRVQNRECSFVAVLDSLAQSTECKTIAIKNRLLMFVMLVSAWRSFDLGSCPLQHRVIEQVVAVGFNKIAYCMYSSYDVMSFYVKLLIVSHCAKSQSNSKLIVHHLLTAYELIDTDLGEEWSKQIVDVINTELITVPLAHMYTKGSLRVLQHPIESVVINSVQESKGPKKACLLMKKWDDCIQQELFKLNFQKVYLLLLGAKRDLLQIVQQGVEMKDLDDPREPMMNIVIGILKYCSQKVEARFGCEILVTHFLNQLTTILPLTYSPIFEIKRSDHQIQRYSYFRFRQGKFDYEAFVLFLLDNHAEITLSDLLSLKLLLAHLKKPQSADIPEFMEYVKKGSRSTQKMLCLFYLCGHQSKCKRHEDTVIAAFLLSMLSPIITYNLFANVAFEVFKWNNTQPSAQSKYAQEILLGIFNTEIVEYRCGDKELAHLLLNLPKILDRLTWQAADYGVVGPILQHQARIHQSQKERHHSASESLIRTLLKNSQHLLAYSQAYQNCNMVKEAIFFIQHHFQLNKENSQSLKNRTAELYTRVNPSFSLAKSQISKLLDLPKMQTPPEQASCLLPALNRLYNMRLWNIDPEDEQRFEGYRQIMGRMAGLLQSEELRMQYLRCCVFLVFVDASDCLSRREWQGLPRLLRLVRQLRDIEERIGCMQILKRQFCQNEQLCKQYWDLLLQEGRADKLLLELEWFCLNQPYEQVDSTLLRYLSKCHFALGDYLKVLMLTSKLSQRREKEVQAEIFQIQLESLCHQRLNYGVDDILTFIVDKYGQADVKGLSATTLARHAQFYLKMFRMLFNRYHFDRTTNNSLLLAAFKAHMTFLENIPNSHSLAVQSVFYLLRFVLEKFHFEVQENMEKKDQKNSQKENLRAKGSYENEIINEYGQHSEWFVPHAKYLTGKIGVHIRKNAIIETLLRFIAVKHPKQCIWTLAFLARFNEDSRDVSPKDIVNKSNPLAASFANISSAVSAQLHSRGIDLSRQIQWISSLVNLAISSSNGSTATEKQLIKDLQGISVPEGLPYMFDSKWDITSVSHIRKTGSGKSAPNQMIFKLKDNLSRKTAKVILKYSRDQPSKIRPCSYLMECNTANFFAAIGILDKDVTYQIQHLSRGTTLVEYVPNMGNLQDVIDAYNTNVAEIEAEMVRNRAHKARKPLKCFDLCEKRVRANLCDIFTQFSNSVEEWWEVKTNFIRTAAQWSYLGYTVGLGDRHVQNILINDRLKLIHIDFEYNLDHGLKLKVPEWVPFRLTRSLQECMGVLGVSGLFYAEMLATAKQFQQQQRQIWRALSFFQGFIDLNTTAAILERAAFVGLKGGLPEGIERIIQQAVDPRYLREMFDGWKSYL